MQISKIKKFLYVNPMRKTVSEAEFLKNLEKRKLVFPYQFGIETMVNEEGDEISEPRGHIYYKLHEIMEAIESGNILKCLQKIQM